MTSSGISPGKALVVLCTGPFVSAAFLVWWLVGDLSEVDGEDRLFRLGFADEHAGAVGLLGVLLAVGIAVEIRRWSLPVRVPLVGPIAGSALSGAYTGLALRVMTATTNGANIGAGLAVIAAPAFLVVLGISAVRIARIGRGVRDQRVRS